MPSSSMPIRITGRLGNRAGSSMVASAAGISTSAHTLNSRPTSPSPCCKVLVTYSGSTTEPDNIAVWNRVKLTAARNMRRLTLFPSRLVAVGRATGGVPPISSSGRATSANAPAVKSSRPSYPWRESTAAPITGPTAHASDHTERSAGVPRRAVDVPMRSRCVRAKVNSCGNAASPAPNSPTPMSSNVG